MLKIFVCLMLMLSGQHNHCDRDKFVGYWKVDWGVVSCHFTLDKDGTYKCTDWLHGHAYRGKWFSDGHHLWFYEYYNKQKKNGIWYGIRFTKSHKHTMSGELTYGATGRFSMRHVK